MHSPEILHTALKKHFGYDAFRQDQESIITHVLEGNDTMVIMPTGGGKSMCFQLPAVLFPKVTLVISPLIALMKDQVDGLNANGIKAGYYNSSQSIEEQTAIIEAVATKNIKLLYVAPESMQGIYDILNEQYISCIAIDEAHCISSWGHDFRPSYQALGFLKKSLPNTPIIALTATADKATREDIAAQLNITHAKTFISSFDRENISLDVRLADDRVGQIQRFIAKRPNTAGIIYCLSRKTTTELADKLKTKVVSATAYHAGLSFEERNKAQEDFIYDKVRVVCATVAFGMGIDKSNVRWVIHYNMPKNIEGYYQEIGRAGRDGMDAEGLLFHSYADVIQLRKFTEGASNQEVQIAKLDRMKQFAEANTCRRKILLSYFGEVLPNNCNNCDVCKNPPLFFNGSVIAQKALSTIARLKENEPIGTVIDVLRGAQNANVLDNDYQNLKTYGIGNDISWRDWQQYILQLINQGACEIAFHKNNKLQLTNLAKEILFSGKKIDLTKPIKEQEKTTKIAKPASKVKTTTSTLFDQLRKLRYKIAEEEGIPAYLVFNDKTLKEIEIQRPVTDDEFLEINGVGDRKLEAYGHLFIEIIKDFNTNKKKKKSNTFKVTQQLFESGLTVDEIATKRNLNSTTIYSHLAKLYSDGVKINLSEYISDAEVKTIKIAKQALNNPSELKPYYELFESKMPYYKIRLALTILENTF